LPRVEREVEPVAADAPARDELGTETVLVVEDDESIRSLVVDALRRRGYTVLEAADGKEALQKATRPIDLLVTDLVMPRMGGVELAEELRRDNPGLVVLYSSGHNVDPSIRSDRSSSFLQKPYTTQGLARKVREILG
jgi:CheY-like chemotaxis protein